MRYSSIVSVLATVDGGQCTHVSEKQRVVEAWKLSSCGRVSSKTFIHLKKINIRLSAAIFRIFYLHLAALSSGAAF